MNINKIPELHLDINNQTDIKQYEDIWLDDIYNVISAET